MIGVRSNVWKSFSEGMGKGDRFIGYVSKKMIFDAIGAIVGNAIFMEFLHSTMSIVALAITLCAKVVSSKYPKIDFVWLNGKIWRW